jgi:hypothetical protein
MKRFVEPAPGATGIPEWWEPLRAATSNHSVFLSGPGCRPGSRFMAPTSARSGCAGRCGEVVAGTLLVHRTVRNRGLPSAHGLLPTRAARRRRAQPFAEINDVGACPAARPTSRADLAAFLEAARWDCLRLSGYERRRPLAPARSLPTALVRAQVLARGLLELGTCASPARSSAALSSNTRSQIRAPAALYEERSGAVSLDAARDPRAGARIPRAVDPAPQRALDHQGEGGTFASADVATFHPPADPAPVEGRRRDAAAAHARASATSATSTTCSGRARWPPSSRACLRGGLALQAGTPHPLSQPSATTPRPARASTTSSPATRATSAPWPSPSATCTGPPSIATAPGCAWAAWVVGLRDRMRTAEAPRPAAVPDPD